MTVSGLDWMCYAVQAAVAGVAPVPADPFGSCTPQRPPYQQDLRYAYIIFLASALPCLAWSQLQGCMFMTSDGHATPMNNSAAPHMS